VTTLIFFSGFDPDPKPEPLRDNGTVSTQTAVPRAYRESRGRWIGGVAVGLAGHLGWPVAAVRILFVLLSIFGGIGVIAYAAYWAVLPARKEDDTDTARLLAFAALIVGGFLLLPTTSTWMQVGLPLAVIVLGATVVWTRVAPGRSLRPDGMQWTALVLGVLLVGLGIVGVAVTGLGLRSFLNLAAVGILLVAGVGLIAMPWIAGLYRELTTERQERVRSQTRAELATQVHDSVLQTLTLIRQHADDPEQVVRLARSEERHLRSWLYEPAGDPEQTLAAALAAAAGKVEQEYATTVEVVCVGDTALDEGGSAVVAAASEAVLNAAKHAGGSISVYAEADDAHIAVFVRDRGAGFDMQAVPEDRKGVSESMMGRMQRAGGSFRIRTDDRGTEVALTLPRPA
jgi:signal transduction histidine kinase